MKFPADAPVRPAKRDELLARVQRLGINLAEVEEGAARAGGPGGQKVNKTSSGVVLRYQLRGATAAQAGAPAPHAPELLVVKWTRERQHALNRFLALRELVDEIEMRVSPQTSSRLKEQARIHKQKDRRRRRTNSRGFRIVE
jgi:peptide chain release factor